MARHGALSHFRESIVRVILLAAIAALALCGCGGGGGVGADRNFNITMPTSTLKAGFFPSELPARVTSEAMVEGRIPDDATVQIRDAGGSFDLGTSSFVRTGGTAWELRLNMRRGLPVGVRKSVVSLLVCVESSCSRPLQTVNRNYEVEVKAPEITAIPDPLVSAVLGDTAYVPLQVTLNGVDPLNIPYVAVTDSSGRFGGGVVRLATDDPGSGIYRARLPWLPGSIPQEYSGTLTLRFCNEASCASAYRQRTLPWRVQVFGMFTGICCVSGMATDAANNVYVADTTRIQKLTAAGVRSTVFERAEGSPHAEPAAVARGADGALYFSRDFGTGIDKLATGGAISRISESTATDMAFGGDGFLYLSNHLTSSVAKLSAAGVPQAWAPSFALDQPIGIVVTAANVAYVADSRGVVSIQPGGAAQFLAPLPGASRPLDVALAGTSVLVTTYFGFYRITAAGAVETIVPQGVPVTVSGVEHVFGPGIIARTSGGRVYVGDASGVLLFTTLP